MNLIATVGRYLFAIPMVIFGVLHFVNNKTLQNVVPSFIPAETFWVYLTGAALISAGICILIKFQVHLIANLLAILLLVFVFFVHVPLVLAGDDSAFNSLLTDVALAGASFVLGQYFKNN